MQEGVCLCDRHQCHTQPLSSVILLAWPGAMLLSRTSRLFSPCQRFMTYEIGNFSRLDRFQLFLYGFNFLYFFILCKDLSSSWAHLKCLFLIPLLPNIGALPTDIEGNKPWSLSRPSLNLWEMKDH